MTVMMTTAAQAALAAAADLVAPWTAEMRQEMRDAVPTQGFRATIGGRTLRDVARDVLAHRLVLTFDAVAEGIDARQVVDHVLALVPRPQVSAQVSGQVSGHVASDGAA